jgi:hypothetical protein
MTLWRPDPSPAAESDEAQSVWMGIIVHSGQSVFVFFLILTLVLG